MFTCGKKQRRRRSGTLHGTGRDILTNLSEMFMFCGVNKFLRPFPFLFIAGILFLGFKVIGTAGASITGIREKNPVPQSTQKPKYDYMSTFLSRNTNPLGLKENPELNKYLNQASIKWAVRSSERHLLN